MGYVYDINSAKKDKISGRCISIIEILNQILATFVSTFLVAYIYSFSADLYGYIMNVGIFYVCNFTFFAIVYFAFSYIVERTNRVIIYRIALVFELIFIIFLIFYGEKLASLIVLAGLLNGLREGLYYSSYNVLKQEMVSRKSIGKYSTLQYAMQKVINIIIPITLGALIDISTYAQTAIYVAILSMVQIVLSCFIRAKRPEGSVFSLRGYFKKLNENPELKKKMVFIYILTAIYGSTTIVSTLVTVCVMMQFGSNISLGILTSIFNVCAFITLLLTNKFTKAGKRSVLFWILAIIPIVLSVMFVFNISKPTLIILNAGIVITHIVKSCVYDTHRNSNLKEANLYSEIAEHQCIVEILLSVTRVLTYAVLILAGLANSLTLFKVLLVIFTLSYSIVYVMLIIYEKKYIKTE